MPTKNTGAGMIIEQKRLGEKGLIALLALLSAFVPLSTDLYLPALPGMSEQFGASPDLINLTLVLFFVFYSAGTLVWGPLSDKYGRKPTLLAGLTIYIVASVLCANARDVYALILFRILQAVGGSTAGTVATAIVKDSFDGSRRESILAVVQSMVLISPAVAPVLGAILLQVTSWQGIFWTLAGIGLVACAGTVLFQETCVDKNTGPLLDTVGRLGRVLQNRRFTALLIVFSLGSISTMAFIASSSYIYMDGFGVSAQVYSYYFMLNAIALILGPLTYLRLARRFRREWIITACFGMIAVSGVLVLLLGNLQPWVFALALLPASFAGSCVRPPGANLMLEQQRQDTGSAASLMGSVGLLMGSLGMFIISLGTLNTILMLGILQIVIGLCCLALWTRVRRRILLIPMQERVEFAPAKE